MRAEHNTSPLDSGGSTADSYSSESTLSTSSKDESLSHIDLQDSGILVSHISFVEKKMEVHITFLRISFKQMKYKRYLVPFTERVVGFKLEAKFCFITYHSKILLLVHDIKFAF